MKLSSISVILTAAAGLVSAAPLRVVIVTSERRVAAPMDHVPVWAQAVRWGHAAAPTFNSLPPLVQPAGLAPPSMGDRLVTEVPHPRQRMRGGCRGMRAKTLQFGNRLRVVLGLPPIDYHSHRHAMGTVIIERLPQSNVVPTHHRHHIRPHYVHRAPLAVRLSHALATLGPWEGRAVSFVLGCGVGAILRMLFVFGVLIVRSVRSCRQERRVMLEEDTVIFVADIKEPTEVETPPAYAEKTDAAPEGHNATN